MTRPECDAFLEDPAGHAGHEDTCESCRVLSTDLDRIDAVLGDGGMDSTSGSLTLKELPLAPWEGANERAWALVVLSGALLLFGAAAFFMLSGISPFRGFEAAASQMVFPRVNILALGTAWARTLQRAPAGIHLILGICFIAVNVLLVFLLRRQPKGIHVPSR